METDNDKIMETADRIKAMGHPLRLKMLCVMDDQERTVTDLINACGTSQSNISQHLSILRDAKIVSTRKHENLVYYRIRDPRTIELVKIMRDVL